MDKVYGVTQKMMKLGQREVVEAIMRDEYARSVHTVWAGVMTGLRCEYSIKKRKAGKV